MNKFNYSDMFTRVSTIQNIYILDVINVGAEAHTSHRLLKCLCVWVFSDEKRAEEKEIKR